jgi:hypothetical protein
MAGQVLIDLPVVLICRSCASRLRLRAKQISSQSVGWAKRQRAHHQDVRSTIDGGTTRTATEVESECGAVAVGRTYLLPPLSFGGALLVRPWLRFHIPLIEPDMQISRIRLSDKTSRLHPRHVVPKPA